MKIVESFDKQSILLLLPSLFYKNRLRLLFVLAVEHTLLHMLLDILRTFLLSRDLNDAAL